MNKIKVFFIYYQTTMNESPEEVGAFRTIKEAEDYMTENNLFEENEEFDNCFFIGDNEFDEDEEIFYTE